MINTGLININNNIDITLFKNENVFNANIENIKSPKIKYKFILKVLNMFSKKRLYKLIEYYKLLICYIYLNSDFENNERRLFYDKNIDQNQSAFNQYMSWLNDIKFDYFQLYLKIK